MNASTGSPAQGPAKKQPNIIWLILDDASPTLGCYGDAQAITPNMDRLAREGARFTRAFTHAPVCAPSRSGLVTGMYPTTIGSHHMRSRLINPPETFMSLLRKTGYYVTWPGKTDFNFDLADPQAQTVNAGPPAGSFDGRATVNADPPAGSFDGRTQWLAAAPPKQPFFAYLNLGVTHESQVRADAAQHAKNTVRLQLGQRHDPARMRVPAYWPDTPEIRPHI